MRFNGFADAEGDSVSFDGTLGEFIGFGVAGDVGLCKQEAVSPDHGPALSWFEVGWHPYD
jgi:hypothetical protein